MAALKREFPSYLILALQYKVRKDQGAVSYQNPEFSYIFPYDRIFYYTRLLLPYPPSLRITDPLKATPDQNQELANYLVNAFEKHTDAELERYLTAKTGHEEPSKVVKEIDQDIAKYPPPPISQTPPITKTPLIKTSILRKDTRPGRSIPQGEEHLITEIPQITRVSSPKVIRRTTIISSPTPKISRVMSPSRKVFSGSIPRISTSTQPESTTRGQSPTLPQSPGVLGGLRNLIRPGLEGLGNGMGKAANSAADSLGRLNNRARNIKSSAAAKRILIALIIFLLIFVLIGGLGALLNFLDPAGERIEGLKNTPTCDKEVNNSTQINCQILVEYTATDSASIEITNTFTSNAKYASGSATDNPIVDETFNSIKWQLKNLTTKTSKILKFALLPQTENDWVQNTVTVARINPLATTERTKTVVDLKSANLDLIFASAASNANMPHELLKAIVKVEAPRTYDYNQEEVSKFSVIGWWEGLESEAPTLPENHPDIIRGYAYNTCQYRNDCAPGSDVRGVAQFEIRTWNGIKGKISFDDSHDPDRRNLTDALFGSAMFNRVNAENYVESKDVTWNEDVIRVIARVYCAGPAAARNPARAQVSACGYTGPGSLTYDDRVWLYYSNATGQ